MALTSTTNRVVATGDNSVVTFNYNRLLYDATHLQVYLAGVLQATGYTVNGVPGTATSVTFAVAPGTGVQVILLRVVPKTQLSVYAVGGAFPAATTEKNLDLLAMSAQQFDETLGRAVTLPVSSTLTAANLPDPALAANFGKGVKIAGDGSGLDTFNINAGNISGTVTTKGDIHIFGAAAEDRLPVGTNGQLVQADSTVARGVKYSGDIPDNILRVVGSTDATKKLAVEVDGFTTATTRTLTPPDQDITLSNSWIGANDFRLSLTTALPVTTADVVGAGTLYCIPFTGSRIALYNGTTWILRNSAQFSLALTLTSSKPYDIFCFDNAGVPTLEVLAWTNDTTRATALVYQDGVLVKSGATTRRYLGSLYATGANTTEDSAAKRNLWNYYHRVTRKLKAIDTTDSWTYTTTTWRQARATATNQVEGMIGVAEDVVEVQVYASVSNSPNAPNAAVGIGLDSTSVNSADLFGGGIVANNFAQVSAFYSAPVAAGRHTFVWLEISQALGTTTWYGDDALTYMQSGLSGIVRA